MTKRNSPWKAICNTERTNGAPPFYGGENISVWQASDGITHFVIDTENPVMNPHVYGQTYTFETAEGQLQLKLIGKMEQGWISIDAPVYTQEADLVTLLRVTLDRVTK